MVDTRSPEQRRRIMAAVHSKDTGPELLVRRYLWSKGIRYRLHPENLPGKPDIVIPRCKIAIFVHGCFWHGHENCSLGRLPKSRVDYWKSKIETNKKRDRLIKEELKALGWHQLVIWSCQLRTKKAASTALPALLNEILNICPDLSSDDSRTL
ncbi:very short patch repair endonuclease [Methanoculleus oceani]|uniref:Very short patch repair endonuclease n=1 Tax=Methanoculleus oceani TaxID=2184756 RepID=A0ABD4TCJ4_9EURY|nr:very short patch repair endonuclease [Methanoculleus sp. CWC-02]